MLSLRFFRLWAVVSTVAFSSIAVWAFRDFVPPRAENASTYACKDAHPTEKVTVALDVYNTSPKADIFNTPYNQEGILPVFLIISNDGDQPVTVKDMQAELVTAGRAKLESLTADDIFRRVAHISGSSTSPARGRADSPRQQQEQESTKAV